MHMNQKGIANILLIVLVIAAIAGVGGYFILNKQALSPTPSPTSTPKPSSTPTPLPTTPEAGDTEEIQALLNKEQWVRVIVMLKGNEFTAPEFRQDDAKQEAEIKKIQDAVLITLTENDFQLSHQYQYVTSFAGVVSRSGMEKLLKNSQVTSISLDRLSAPN